MSDAPQKVRLFIKSYCGWCHEAMAWLDKHGIAYEAIDVIGDGTAQKEMILLSGQTLTPVIDVDGEVLGDFGEMELEKWWQDMDFGFPDKQG